MEKEFEYKGHKYWVKVEPAVNQETEETGFIAFVNNDKPGVLLYGESVKDAHGRTIFFKTELSASMNAHTVKQSEIDGKII